MRGNDKDCCGDSSAPDVSCLAAVVTVMVEDWHRHGSRSCALPPAGLAASSPLIPCERTVWNRRKKTNIVWGNQLVPAVSGDVRSERLMVDPVQETGDIIIAR